jgi:hypothetical protein
MRSRSHGSPQVVALLVAFLIALALLGAWAGQERLHRRAAPPVVGDETAASEPDTRRRSGRPLAVELVAGELLERTARIELAVAARRFAITLAAWLYSDRRRMLVAPVVSEVREQLASEPPYVPRRQIGSGDGRAVRVQVFVQTRITAMLVVTVRDSRAIYPFPAVIERRARRWRIVRLNTH